jgi:hypothetical protein
MIVTIKHQEDKFSVIYHNKFSFFELTNFKTYDDAVETLKTIHKKTEVTVIKTEYTLELK